MAVTVSLTYPQPIPPIVIIRLFLGLRWGFYPFVYLQHHFEQRHVRAKPPYPRSPLPGLRPAHTGTEPRTGPPDRSGKVIQAALAEIAPVKPQRMGVLHDLGCRRLGAAKEDE